MRLLSASILLSTIASLVSAESLRSYDARRLDTKSDGEDTYQSKKAGSVTMGVENGGPSNPTGSKKVGGGDSSYHTKKVGGPDYQSSGKNSKTSAPKGNKKGGDDGADSKQTQGGSDYTYIGKKDTKAKSSKGNKKQNDYGDDYDYGDNSGGYDVDAKKDSKKGGDYGDDYKGKQGSKKGGKYGADYDYGNKKGSKKGGDYGDNYDSGGTNKGANDYDQGETGDKSSSPKASTKVGEYDDYTKVTKGTSGYYLYSAKKDSKSLASKSASPKPEPQPTAKVTKSSKGNKKGEYVEYDEAVYSDKKGVDSTKTGKKRVDYDDVTTGGLSDKGEEKASDCITSKKSGSTNKSTKKGSEDKYTSVESDNVSKKGKADSGKGRGHGIYSSKNRKSSQQRPKAGYNGCEEEPTMAEGYPPAPVAPPTPEPIDSGHKEPTQPEPAPVSRPTMVPPSPVAAPLPTEIEEPAPVAMPTEALTTVVPSPVAEDTAVPEEEEDPAPVTAPSEATETEPEAPTPSEATELEPQPTAPSASPNPEPQPTASFASPQPEPQPTASSASPQPEPQPTAPSASPEPQPTAPDEGPAAPSSKPVPSDSAGSTLIGVASGISDLSTFVTILSNPAQGDLYFALLGDGPFTIFAPSNEALSKYSQTVDTSALTAQETTSILAYHVYDKELRSDEIQDGFIIALNGDGVYLDSTNGGVTLNGDVNVIQADILGSNGVIHVIDQVLIPPQKDVTGVAVDNGLEQFLRALEVTDLSSVLQEDGPFTVFAPTDAAFAKLGQNTVDALFNDVSTLSDLVLYHVTSGYVGTGDLAAMDSLETQAEGGQRITVKMSDGVVLNGNAKLTVANLVATNGVVHLIDKVLIPPVMGDPQQ